MQAIRKLLPKEIEILPVIKNDAYGHGLVEVAKTLASEQVYGFGLSEPYEAYLLRKAGLIHPILLLSGFEKDWLFDMYNLRIIPVVTSVHTMEWLAEFTYKKAIKWEFHLKINTGMNRFGVEKRDFAKILSILKENPQLNVIGIMTHLACSENSEHPLTINQLKEFSEAITYFKKKGINFKFIHLCNSGGIIFLKEKGNLVRPGIILFGGYPNFKARAHIKLYPVMTLKSKIVELKKLKPGESVGYGATFKTSKKSVLAIVPVGYGDGYLRSLSNKGFAWIKGKRVPVVGTISMNCLYLDVTEVNNVEIGDEVILLGGEREEVPVDELANLADTISYELFCSLGKSIKRVYKE